MKNDDTLLWFIVRYCLVNSGISTIRALLAGVAAPNRKETNSAVITGVFGICVFYIKELIGHGDCTIIEHRSGRVTMIDINNSQTLRLAQ